MLHASPALIASNIQKQAGKKPDRCKNNARTLHTSLN